MCTGEAGAWCGEPVGEEGATRGCGPGVVGEGGTDFSKDALGPGESGGRSEEVGGGSCMRGIWRGAACG